MQCPACGQELGNADLIGHKVRGVFDGVLVWQCLTCGHAWSRFDDPADPPERVGAAMDYAAAINRRVKAGVRRG